MLGRLFNAIHERERRFRRSFGRDIETPGERWKSRLHFELLDHAVLRHLWTNFAEIAPGAYRSNHPGHGRLKRYKAKGIRTVISLRGHSDWSHTLFERESCAKLGLTLRAISLNARKAPERQNLQELIALFRDVHKPFVMHCKSGADRAGLASVIYLMVIEGRSLEQARPHLSWRFLHLRSTKTGVLDELLDAYAPFEAHKGFETWLAEDYDPAAVTAAFAARRSK